MVVKRCQISLHLPLVNREHPLYIQVAHVKSWEIDESVSKDLQGMISVHDVASYRRIILETRIHTLDGIFPDDGLLVLELMDSSLCWSAK